EARRRLRSDELRELVPVHAAEARVEPAPPRDAVDVGRDLDRRQLEKLLPRQTQRLLDLAEDTEVPRGEIRVRNAARVQDRPLVGQVLPRRKTRGVVACVANLRLGFRSEEGHGA